MPHEILEKVRAARPYEQDDVASAFEWTPVDWRLDFLSANRMTVDGSLIMLTFRERNKVAMVYTTLPVKGTEYLRLVEAGEKFRVKGFIHYVHADTAAIYLQEASIERLSDAAKPSTH